jgi:hypothetical protein
MPSLINQSIPTGEKSGVITRLTGRPNNDLHLNGVFFLSKPILSKLFKLKQWLTLPEAAKHLSGICGEEVTIADILRLALDGHLTLSVNFVNHAKAKPGQVIGPEDVVWQEFPPLFKSDDIPEIPVMIPDSLYIGNESYIKFQDKVVSIQGVWDLPMIGNERIDIEYQYQALTNGPAVELIGLDGAFVKRHAGEIYQLQESFGDHYGYEAAEKAQFNKFISLKFSKGNNKRKENLLILRKEKLEKLKKIKNEWNNYGRYYPAGGLPEDCALVVRTHALREFEQLIDNATEKNTTTKSHGNTERFAQNREKILGAALYVITQWPNHCHNSSGKFEATKIAEMIDSKSGLFWPDSGEPPLSREKMEREISKWINKIGR